MYIPTTLQDILTVISVLSKLSVIVPANILRTIKKM